MKPEKMKMHVNLSPMLCWSLFLIGICAMYQPQPAPLAGILGNTNITGGHYLIKERTLTQHRNISYTMSITGNCGCIGIVCWKICKSLCVWIIDLHCVVSGPPSHRTVMFMNLCVCVLIRVGIECWIGLRGFSNFRLLCVIHWFKSGWPDCENRERLVSLQMFCNIYSGCALLCGDFASFWRYLWSTDFPIRFTSTEVLLLTSKRPITFCHQRHPWPPLRLHPWPRL